MTDSSPAAVELVDVSAGYRARGGYRAVLEGVDLRVHEGEMVALLGTNGSGKTTLLRVVAGGHPQTGGRVRLFGRELDEWRRGDVARLVAVLPQALQLPAGFRAAEIVGMGRIPHASSWLRSGAHDERAVQAALRDADALDLADRRVDELSGGERQRVLVAMALAQEPRLLLLDEPTLHLDLAHQQALVRTLARLRRVRGLTVVAVLHDLNLAAGFADRAVFLHRRRIEPAGSSRRPIEPLAAGRVFGVPIEEALTTDGRPLLGTLPRQPETRRE